MVRKTDSRPFVWKDLGTYRFDRLIVPEILIFLAIFTYIGTASGIIVSEYYPMLLTGQLGAKRAYRHIARHDHCSGTLCVFQRIVPDLEYFLGSRPTPAEQTIAAACT